MTPLYISPYNTAAAWELEGQRVVILLGARARIPEWDDEAFRAIQSALQGRAYHTPQGTRLIQEAGTQNWRVVRNATDARTAIMAAITILTTIDPADLDLSGIAIQARHADSPLDLAIKRSAATRQYEVVKAIPPDAAGASVLPDGSLEVLSGGAIHHPWAGTPSRAWLWVDPLPLPAADPTYPHWRRLFSAFDLPPHDHAALHVHLLACLHAVSLDQERPALLVDSWERARGKSESSHVLSILLDGEATSLEISPSRTSAHDTLVAHLNSGARVLPMHNLDNVAGFNNPFIDSICTDGAMSARAKYAAGTAKFHGIVPCLSTVYGAASLSVDLLCRCFRVELPGRAQPLDPRPREYARAHRAELLAEALHAHAQERRFTREISGLELHSRFKPFESVGALAYSQIFGVDLPEVSRRMGLSFTGARALLPSGPPSLYRAHPGAFQEARAEVTGCIDKPDGLTGARALGYEYNGSSWIETEPRSE